MTDSLYKIYKKFYQRAYRNTDDIELKSMSDSIYSVIKDLYNAESDIEKSSLIKSNAKKFAKEINKRETAIKPTVLFSLEFIKALNKKKLDYGIPYQVLQRWNSKDRKGLIYILTSTSKKNLCKLGATTLTMKERIYQYERRYDYSVKEYFSKEISSPLELELVVANKMKEYRVAGNTYKESNEWYACKPSFMKSKIILEIAEKRKLVKE